jgi:lysophospholipase L1-like esterase
MNTHLSVKRILCYGDSLTFGKIPGPTKRYSSHERWTGLLQNLLGAQYEIIEEGLRGRTTDLNDPNSIGRNGLEYFQSSILSHLPLDLVIILLGTNDLKEKFNRNAHEIASVFIKYKEAISFAAKYLEEKEPEILLLSPPLIDENHALAEWGFKGGETKSKELCNEYQKIATEIHAHFLDLSSVIKPSNLDGIHLDKGENKKLAHIIHQEIIKFI